jgi:SAM-dependent methyltransferase
MKTADVFNEDAIKNKGYLYTTNARLSSILANLRMTEAVCNIADFHNKKVIDIGCGDGAYTIELFDKSRPASVLGVDPAPEAVKIARTKINGRPLAFEVLSADKLPYDREAFDIACLRGVLHHGARPCEILREAMRVARTLVIVEPNGYNPGLKLLEKVSPYHRKHNERSFAPLHLRRWVKRSEGAVLAEKYAGFVPMFCPDVIARCMKRLEPVVEHLPLIRFFLCSVYIIVVTRK